MSSKLPPSVLLALGLSAGCQQCGQPHLGPCLSIMPDPEPEPPPPPSEPSEPTEPTEPKEPEMSICLSMLPPERVGPCLDFPVEPPEPPVEPCLEYIQEPDPEPAPAPAPEPEGSETGARQDARARVLAKGVLPEDIAAILRSRRS